MDAMKLIQKMSKLYIRGLTDRDHLMAFVLICVDLLRELEIAKMSGEPDIALMVGGQEHKKLLNLIEAIDAKENNNE